jgi:hypothetical protein
MIFLTTVGRLKQRDPAVFAFAGIAPSHLCQQFAANPASAHVF